MRSDFDLEDAHDALQVLDSGCDRLTWHTIGRASIAAGLSIEDIDAWSATAGNYAGTKDVHAAFRTIKREGGTGPGTLFRMALDAGWVPTPKAPRSSDPAPVTKMVVDKVPEPHVTHQRLSEWGLDLWRSCRPLSGVALSYLRARHCQVPPAHGDLRWHPALKHPSGYVGPALVALITTIHANESLSLHRTWITPAGKAELDTPRLPLWNHSTKNGVIRLWPDDEVSAVLGFAEGIETALSLAWALTPVWATIDAGHMAQFPVLGGIGTLVIAQDQDPAGMSAAAICARRWAEADKEVFVTRQAANDLNDVLHEVSA